MAPRRAREPEPEPRPNPGNVEVVLEKLFEVMDPVSLAKACLVNRMWRSIAKKHLKRQMQVWLSERTPEYQQVVVSFTFEALPKCLLYTEEKIPDGPLHLHYIHSRGNTVTRHTVKKRIPTPSAIVYAFEQPWITRVTELDIDCCFTIYDWMTLRNVIIKKLVNLVSLKIVFAPKANVTTVPLCFTELSNQWQPPEGTVEQLRSDTLRSVIFCFRPFEDHAERPARGLYEEIIREIFRMCPNLTVFEEEGIHGFGQKVFLSRSTNRKDVKAEAATTWVAGFGDIKYMTPDYKRFLKFMLTVVPIRKFCTPIRQELFDLLDADPELQSIMKNLDKLCFYSYIRSQMDPIHRYIPTAMFINVTSLYWTLYSYQEMRHWSDMPVAEDSPTFPNLRVLHLHRKPLPWACPPPRENVFVIDDWICSNFNKLAPSVRKLTINTYNHGRTLKPDASTDWRDCYNVMKIVQSFGSLQELVLINYQRQGRRVWTDLQNVTQVAECMNGLTTVKLVLQDPVLLRKYRRGFNAAVSRPGSTVREFQVLRANDQGADGQRGYAEGVDLSQFTETDDQYCLDKMDIDKSDIFPMYRYQAVGFTRNSYYYRY